MINNNRDLYDIIRRVRDSLREAGEEEWSSALDDALSVSSVPGEILGETRLQLQRLRAAQVANQLGLNGLIDEALAYLNQILSTEKT